MNITMPPFDDLQIPPQVVVVGLGKTGLSCVRFLVDLGVEVAVTDSRPHPPGLQLLRDSLPDVAVFTGGFDSRVFAQAQMLVVSPGVPLNTPVIQAATAAAVPVVGDIELFSRVVNKPVVAITGANGKSTVTTLLADMAAQAGLNVAAGGNLGIPALDLLDNRVDLYVLELSSFQLETTHSLSTAVATVLNISPDHMDRYADLDAYARVKEKIYARAEVGVFNADDERVSAMRGSEQALYFSLDAPADENTFGICTRGGTEILCRGKRALLDSSEVLMPGRHNLANALAALAMAHALHLPLDAMQRSLRSFRGLAHRVEYIATINEVRWYNDSKATNPGAAIAALTGLNDGRGGETVLIAGGDCKGADFSSLGGALRSGVRALVLLGRDKDCIRRVLDSSLAVVEAVDMLDAVQLAADLAQPGDRVLLSPACASFDMFNGFEHRGDVFRRHVQEMTA